MRFCGQLLLGELFILRSEISALSAILFWSQLDLGRDSPGVELFDEQNSANGKAQGFLEGSRWASQLSLFPV